MALQVSVFLASYVNVSTTNVWVSIGREVIVAVQDRDIVSPRSDLEPVIECFKPESDMVRVSTRFDSLREVVVEYEAGPCEILREMVLWLTDGDSELD